MNDPQNHIPPKWPLRFLRWVIKDDYLEEIEGDMEEVFQDYLDQYPLKKAKRRYALDTLKLLRPGLLKNISSSEPIIHTAMFRHNLLITYRSFLRNKSSFLINLVGLTTGMACVLLIYLWVADEFSVDKFHANDSRLYQIMENESSQGDIHTSFVTSEPLAKALKEEMPEVKYAAAVAPPYWPGHDNFTLSNGEKDIKATGQYVDEDYFNIFSYDLIYGNKDLVLTDKNGIVISEDLAINLFNTLEGVVGKSVEFQHEREFIISGIFKTVPMNSSIQFDFALALDVLRAETPWILELGARGPRGYVVLKEGVNVDEFNAKIADFIKLRIEDSNRSPFLASFSGIYLHSNYQNGVGAGGRIEYVRLFSIIALFILFIACINFMNLSTAKATRRLKEIGIKKVIGSGRKELIFQYIGESTMMASISIILAILLVEFFLPQFNEITGKELELAFDLKLIISGLLLTAFTGICAGSYPALYLSGFKPITVLKGKLPSSFGEVWARKGLVVFQFSLSILLMVGVWVVYQQMSFIQQQHLGYDRSNVIYFDVDGNLNEKAETFLSEIKKIPGVVNASSTTHNMIGQSWSSSSLTWDGKSPDDLTQFEVAGVYYDFVETVEIELKKGRSFSRDFGADSAKIVLNEAAIKAIGLIDPIGKKVNFMGEKEIVGVVNNFYFESFRETLKPLIMILMPNGGHYMMAKLEAGKEKEAIAGIQEFYEKINPGFTFEYQFLDEDYQAQYEAEERVSILSRYFAGFAIIISCLGLFGLAAFTAARKLKEIGIRKILGSSVWGIITLLSGEFTKMVFAAILISLPIAYFMSRHWLGGFAYKIELEWWFFAGAAAMALVIAWITVGFQTLKAASINPVDCLRDE